MWKPGVYVKIRKQKQGFFLFFSIMGVAYTHFLSNSDDGVLLTELKPKSNFL